MVEGVEGAGEACAHVELDVRYTAHQLAGQLDQWVRWHVEIGGRLLRGRLIVLAGQDVRDAVRDAAIDALANAIDARALLRHREASG